MRRPAFTLLELLTVIALILLLVAILFPVFSRARERVRTGVCLSQMRQLGTAVEMYLQDWDETFPWAGRPWPYQPLIDYWGEMDPYVKNPSIYTCPSDSLPRWNDYDMQNQFPPLQYEPHHPASYYYLAPFYNQMFPEVPTTIPHAEKLGSVAYPGQKALLACFGNYRAGSSHMADGLAFVFVDGHAALVPRAKMTEGVPYKLNPDWNPEGLAGKNVRD